MKTKGAAIIGTIIATMEIGSQYYCESGDILITTEGQFYLDLNGIASNTATNFNPIPIKKLSKEKEDYEINFDIDWTFYPVCSEVIEARKKETCLIGPFPIGTLKEADVTEENWWDRMDINTLRDILTDLEKSDKANDKEFSRKLKDYLFNRQEDIWETMEVEELSPLLYEFTKNEEFEKAEKIKKIIEKKSLKR